MPRRRLRLAINPCRAIRKNSAAYSPRTHELSLLLCLGTGAITGYLIPFTTFRNQGKDVLAAGMPMPQQPAANNRAGAADAPPAVHVNAKTLGEFLVNVVEEHLHLFDGRDAKVRYLKTTDTCPTADGLVVVHEMFISPTPTVLCEIDKISDSGGKQLLDSLNPIPGCVPMSAGVSASSELAGHHPIGTICWTDDHRFDGCRRYQLGQARQTAARSANRSPAIKIDAYDRKNLEFATKQARR